MFRKIVLTSVLVCAGLPAHAKDGDVVSGFQTQGHRLIPISATTGASLSSFIALQSDGRIVAATSSSVGIGVDADFFIERLAADGSADSTFAGNGEQKLRSSAAATITII